MSGYWGYFIRGLGALAGSCFEATSLLGYEHGVFLVAQFVHGGPLSSHLMNDGQHVNVKVRKRDAFGWEEA